MPELTLTLVVPPALLGRAIAVTGAAGFVALDYLARHDVAPERAPLSLHQSDDPYRRLLEGE